jgi:hypothetical protein
VAVELTSPVLGQEPGYSYTGSLEDWLLSEGYAKRVGYTGPGVANTGATSAALPAEDPTLAENREAPYFPTTPDENTTIANDAENLTKDKFPAPGGDFDASQVDDDDPVTDVGPTNPDPAAEDFDPEDVDGSETP